VSTAKVCLFKGNYLDKAKVVQRREKGLDLPRGGKNEEF
jgi:hypothetical protein